MGVTCDKPIRKQVPITFKKQMCPDGTGENTYHIDEATVLAAFLQTLQKVYLMFEGKVTQFHSEN